MPMADSPVSTNTAHDEGISGMAILPTAHATQRFGSRAVDFYVAPGQVIGSDPRARADERRIQDLDGERHPVRIGRRDFALDAGDYAAVIRLQPGPKRRSRPVAVVNYRAGTWTRTHQDNTGLLSSAGVSRNANWFLTIMAMTVLALLVVWPQLVGVVDILAPGLAAGLPAFDVFSAMVNLQPGLADARLADLAPGLTESIATIAPALAGYESLVIFAGLTALGTLLAFAARSWRFAWVPVFLVLLLAAAIAISGPQTAAIPALLALAGSIGFFFLAGIINRWRDAARLEARIARLADHVLRHPPQEMVTRREATPAMADHPASDTAEAGQEPARDGAAAPGITPVAATAAISARTAESGTTPPETGEAIDADNAADEGSSAQDTADQSAASDADATDANTVQAGAEDTDGPQSGADIDNEEPESVQSGLDETAIETGSDARAEARSMDIPPPPPMATEPDAGNGAGERVNRDAEQGETSPSEPAVTDTTTLQPGAPITSGGIPAGASDNAGEPSAAPDGEPATDIAEDDAFEAGDAYVSQDGDQPRQG